jgi:hypothetical protein
VMPLPAFPEATTAPVSTAEEPLSDTRPSAAFDPVVTSPSAAVEPRRSATPAPALSWTLIPLRLRWAPLLATMPPSLTVLAKSRHYAHFFKQEVSLDEGTAGV